MSKVYTIAPYYDESFGVWCFDDLRFNLVKEALIDGTDIIIEEATKDFGIHAPESGFLVDFSDEPFEGSQIELCKRYPRDFVGGYFYYSAKYQQLGWLCPALFHYFTEAPDIIYVRVRES